MKMGRLLAGMLAAVAISTGAGLADSLPIDEPIVYGAPELDESAVPEGTEEIQDGETVTLYGREVRPGEKARVNTFTVKTVADIQFKSPTAPAIVNMTNPENSTVISQYTLRISAQELAQKTGRTFGGEDDYIELARTKGVAPGSMIQTMTLGTLPDGSTLPAGDYDAEVIVTAYDTITHEKSMVGSLVKVAIRVLSDEVELLLDRNGEGDIHAYNPSTGAADVRYAVMISQKAIEAGCGAPHRTDEELAAQKADAAFDPAYEWITLYESEPVAPGEYLDETIQLANLPDGEHLPAGKYTAYLACLTYDDALGLWQIQQARTGINITVSAK